jgi:hypothetical protein
MAKKASKRQFRSGLAAGLSGLCPRPGNEPTNPRPKSNAITSHGYDPAGVPLQDPEVLAVHVSKYDANGRLVMVRDVMGSNLRGNCYSEHGNQDHLTRSQPGV